ncbi:MAG: hypothetical protein ACXV3S_11705 [Kineosporiaceae bacterium]
MSTSRRTAGLGLLVYGLGTAIAFMSIGSPGGDYSDAGVAAYIARGHWATAFALAYLGAFAALGLLLFARRMRTELGSAGDALWGLCLAGTAVAGTGWFMVGGVAVAAAEGGHAVTTVPHPAIYLVSEISNLVAICASAFLVGVAALVLGARSALPRPLRVASYVAGACGLLAAFFFPLFLFWLWAIVTGAWVAATGARVPEPAVAQVQPA